MAMMNRNREKVDASQLEIKDTVVSINRVTKVVKGGKNLSFSALVVVGDGHGVVGFGVGKAKEVPSAIKKGIEAAKKSLIRVLLRGTTIPHQVVGKFGSGSVLPAQRGARDLPGADGAEGSGARGALARQGRSGAGRSIAMAKQPAAKAARGKSAAKAAVKKLKITLLRSPIGFNRTQGKTVEGMGLRRIRHSVELPDTPATRGMILKVRHLIEVAE